MPEIKSKDVFVKIGPAEAVGFKKELLEIQLSFLEILKHNIAFQQLRKQEAKEKQETKRKNKEIMQEIDRILGLVPRSEEKEKKKEKKGKKEKIRIIIPRAKGRASKTAKLEAELQEIREKIAEL